MKQIYIAAITIGLASAAQANTIAVTELHTKPNTGDTNEEWIELFNYGLNPVNLAGWTWSDDFSTVALPAVNLSSGGYLLVSPDSALFASLWPTVTTPVVEAWGAGQLSNSEDQVVIRNAVDQIVWNLGYMNDETTGLATSLAVDDFSITDYGFAQEEPVVIFDPKVVRNGFDLVSVANWLGYENVNPSPGGALLFQSQIEPFQSLNGDWGTPGTGNYSVVPIPAALPLFASALASFGFLARRRKTVA